ncbi:HNH endonuclease signature motif containing protein [Tsukamurella sp. PLM1]|uniref:HNH endonuclease signature motif containing protein n=1 Tax=Tsukamurella sp. PLM1 TaxID=2929795 RepID=UPI0020C18983|nr:HNH endonuclease signature motif containing protein [Tsukamurella sp. PLM1]
MFPFCGRPASRAQIDHRTEFDHRDPGLGGATTAEQLQPLCVPHHQLKTAGAWIDARLPDGRILWTSPHGRRYIVDPSGIVLQLFPDLLRVQWLIPDGAVPGSVVSARGRLVPEAAHSGGRTRLQREHARRERLRERNVAALLAEQSAAAQSRSAVEDSVLRAIGVTPPLPRMPTDDEPPPY